MDQPSATIRRYCGEIEDLSNLTCPLEVRDGDWEGTVVYDVAETHQRVPGVIRFSIKDEKVVDLSVDVWGTVPDYQAGRWSYRGCLFKLTLSQPALLERGFGKHSFVANIGKGVFHATVNADVGDSIGVATGTVRKARVTAGDTARECGMSVSNPGTGVFTEWGEWEARRQ